MYLDADDPMLAPISLRRELVAAGESDHSLARALRSGALERPRRGAYTDGPAWRSMTDEQRYAVRCRAAYRQASAEVCLSHASALPLLGAPVWDVDLTDVHLTRLDGRTGRREAGINQHRGAVGEGDILSEHDYRISSPLRAALEITTMASVESSLVAVNFFLHRRDFTPGQLRDSYVKFERWPGSLKSDLVVRLADPRIESPGESRTAYFLWRFSFPSFEPQYEISDRGELIALLDFALPDHKIWIEFDGRVKYQKYLKAGEDATTVVLREKRREERVAEITGWRCLRVTWADLAHPERLAARLRKLIDSMGARVISVR